MDFSHWPYYRHITHHTCSPSLPSLLSLCTLAHCALLFLPLCFLHLNTVAPPPPPQQPCNTHAAEWVLLLVSLSPAFQQLPLPLRFTFACAALHQPLIHSQIHIWVDLLLQFYYIKKKTSMAEKQALLIRSGTISYTILNSRIRIASIGLPASLIQLQYCMFDLDVNKKKNSTKYANC